MDDDPRTPRSMLARAGRSTLAATVIGGLVAGSVLVGWAVDAPWLATWGGTAASTPWTVASLGLVALAAVVGGVRRRLVAGTALVAALGALAAPAAATRLQLLLFDVGPVSSPGTALSVVLLVGALVAGTRFAVLRVGLVAGAVSLAHTAALGALLDIDWAVQSAADTPAVGMALPTVALVWAGAVAVWTSGEHTSRLALQVLAPAVVASASAPWLIASIAGGLQTAVWLAAAATSVTAAVTVAMLSYARTHEEVLAGVNRLIEAAPDAMLLVDGDGVIVHANVPAATLFEHSVTDLVGGSVEALVPGSARNHHRRLRETFTSTPRTRMMDAGNVVRVERADGEEIPVSIALAPMSVADDLLVAVTVRDVTEQEERVQALVKLERMQRLFMSAVSHELRTPLSIVQASADTLTTHRRDLDEETVDHLLERLAANARRLDGLLTDLLNLQRVERGELGEPTSISSTEVMRMLVAAGRDVALDELTVGRPTACPPVAVDRILLRRAVQNLLHNARKYAPGPVEVTLAPDGDGVEIRVEDHGPGVPERLRSGIFDAFRRGDQVDPATPGVGIGLSLVAGVASAAGGRAWVDDRADGEPGASFRLWLPAADAAEVADANDADDEFGADPRRRAGNGASATSPASGS